MCLHKLSDVDLDSKEDQFQCYKAFQLIGEKYFGCIRDGFEFSKGVNSNTGQPQLSTDKSEKYSSGFHCFLSEDDAQLWIKTLKPFVKWMILPVVVHKNKVCASGIQKAGDQEFQCIVASEIELK